MEIDFVTVLEGLKKAVEKHGEEDAQKAFALLSEVNEVAKKYDDDVKKIAVEVMVNVFETGNKP